MTEQEPLTLKWAGLMGAGEIAIDKAMAIRLFETAAEKEAASAPRFYAPFRGRYYDTVFIYPEQDPQTIADDTAHSDDAEYLSLAEICDVFEQAGKPLVPMRNQSGVEYLVNPDYAERFEGILTQEAA